MMRILFYVFLALLFQSCQDKEVKVNQSKVAATDVADAVKPEFALTDDQVKGKTIYGLVAGYDKENHVVLDGVLFQENGNNFSVIDGNTLVDVELSSEILGQLELGEYKNVVLAYKAKNNFQFRFFNDYESVKEFLVGNTIENNIALDRIVTINNDQGKSMMIGGWLFPRGGKKNPPGQCRNGNCGGGGIPTNPAPAPKPAPAPAPEPGPKPSDPGKPNPGVPCLSAPGYIPCGIKNGEQHCCQTPDFECAMLNANQFECRRPSNNRCTESGRTTRCGPDGNGYRWCCADSETCGTFPNEVCKAKPAPQPEPPKTPSNPPAAPEDCYTLGCANSNETCAALDGSGNQISCPGAGRGCSCMMQNANQPDPGTPPVPEPDGESRCRAQNGTWCSVGPTQTETPQFTCCEAGQRCKPEGGCEITIGNQQECTRQGRIWCQTGEGRGQSYECCDKGATCENMKCTMPPPQSPGTCESTAMQCATAAGNICCGLGTVCKYLAGSLFGTCEPEELPPPPTSPPVVPPPSNSNGGGIPKSHPEPGQDLPGNL